MTEQMEPTTSNDTEKSLIESDEDLRALRTFGLYNRRLPIPLIQKTMGISRATVYRDIERGREIYGLKPGELVSDIVYMNDDTIREAYGQYGDIDNIPDLSPESRFELKVSLRSHINQLLQTRINAAKLLIPKSDSVTVTSVPTPEGPAVQVVVKRDQRSIGDIFKQLDKEKPNTNIS